MISCAGVQLSLLECLISCAGVPDLDPEAEEDVVALEDPDAEEEDGART